MTPRAPAGVCIRLIHATPQDLRDLYDQLPAGTPVQLVDHGYVVVGGPDGATLQAPPAPARAGGLILTDVGQIPGVPYANSAAPALLDWAVAEARSRGFPVLIAPHLDLLAWDGTQASVSGWRGNLRVGPLVQEWTQSYGAWLGGYAQIARSYQADLAIGCELVKVTEDLGVAWWQLIARIVAALARDVPLTYKANWGVGPDAEYWRLAALWPQLAYIGIDWYAPLRIARDPSLGDLVAAWHARPFDPVTGQPFAWARSWVDDLTALSTQTGQAIVLTEIGYPARDYAAWSPWDAGQGPANPALQARCYQAALTSLPPTVVGLYAWEAAHPGIGPQAHDVLTNPATRAVLFGPGAP